MGHTHIEIIDSLYTMVLGMGVVTLLLGWALVAGAMTGMPVTLGTALYVAFAALFVCLIAVASLACVYCLGTIIRDSSKH